MRAMNTKIFISYSSSNARLVLDISARIRHDGFDVWMDKDGVQPGEAWDTAVQNAINDCIIFIVVLSRQSVKSEVVLNELAYAVDRSKTIVPIRLESCDLPLAVLRIKYIDLSEDLDAGIQKLLWKLDNDPKTSWNIIEHSPPSFLASIKSEIHLTWTQWKAFQQQASIVWKATRLETKMVILYLAFGPVGSMFSIFLGASGGLEKSVSLYREQVRDPLAFFTNNFLSLNLPLEFYDEISIYLIILAALLRLVWAKTIRRGSSFGYKLSITLTTVGGVIGYIYTMHSWDTWHPNWYSAWLSYFGVALGVYHSRGNAGTQILQILIAPIVIVAILGMLGASKVFQ